MLALLVHRGPDAEGIFRGEGCALGHRRLSIVDLSEAGNQPMRTSDGRFAMVANGEIYNHLECRRELEAKGHRFASQSDCEVLLHGWREWGAALFPKLNGMFAVAIWDDVERELILARDRIGIKPLYLHHDGDTLTFASEIKALLGRDRTWRLSPSALGQFLALQNMLGPKTLLDGIEMLEPGQWLQFRRGRCTRHVYWEPTIGAGRSCFAECVEAFRDAAGEAVKRHLMADVPASTYLSAGFDSGGVTALAAELNDAPITSVTGAFDKGGWYDEASAAAETAKFSGVKHRIASIKPEDFTTELDDLIWALDEPRMGMGALPQFIVARSIARSHKFVLTGHGGDELFSGYPIFKILQAASGIGEARRLLPSMRLSELPHLAYFWPHRFQPAQKRQGMPMLFAPGHVRRLFRDEVCQAVEGSRPANVLMQHVKQVRSDYERLFMTYLRVYLPGLLVVEDKISMAHSLEARTPLLDNALVDLALAIAPETKLHRGELKAIPKAAFRPSLPSSLYDLPKRGFPTPLAPWLRGPLRSWFVGRLDPERSPLATLIRPEALRRERETFLSAWTRHWRPLDEIGAHRIWMLLAMDAWLRVLNERLGVRVVI